MKLISFLFLCLFSALNASAQEEAKPESVEEISLGPPPQWIESFPIDLTSLPESHLEAGSEYFLLSEYQYDSASETKFYRYIKRFNSESGLQDGSQLEVSFNPAYQTLEFHELTIIRNGKRIDKLANQDFETIQREQNHERQLYDSRRTAIALVEDTRVGDLMEYAFSVKGTNPVFGDEFSWNLTTSYSVPIGHIRGVLRIPDGLEIEVKSHVENYEPTVSSENGYETFVWSIDEPEPVASEKDLPPDFDTWGWVEASTYLSWEEVVNWALENYVIPDTLPAALEEKLREIGKLENSERKILASLRFVQDEIRYLGLSHGIHSHKPYPLETILSRRFGDCKDKSLILTAMLRDLGFDASPALVETDWRHAIRNWLPSPSDFNHLVVRLSFQGQEYWLDPTRSYQRGKLSELYFPNYGYALLIAEGVTDLTAIEPQGFDVSKTRVTERFHLEDYLGEADFEVNTIYYGRNANSMRAYFASTAKTEIESDYLNYYSGSYHNIESIEPISFEDNETENIFTVNERYTIPNIWEDREGDEEMVEAWFRSKYVYDKIAIPSTKQRTTPFAIRTPVDIAHEIFIELPTGMDEEDESILIENPAFQFNYNTRFDGTTTKLSFAYRSLDDRVPPDRIESYLKDASRAEDLTAYSIYIGRDLHEGKPVVEQDEDFRANWPIIALIVMSLCGSAIFSFLLYRWRPNALATRRLEQTLIRNDLVGIRGWLLLPALGACIRPIAALILCGALFFEYDAHTWELLTDPDSSSYHPLWAPMILLEVVGETVLFPLSVASSILFFRKVYTAPAIYIFLLVCEVVFATALWLLVRAASTDATLIADYASTIRSTLPGAIIWAIYFCVSARVAATFRNGLPTSETEKLVREPGLPPEIPPLPDGYSKS